jgi:hypothetical protein
MYTMVQEDALIGEEEREKKRKRFFSTFFWKKESGAKKTSIGRALSPQRPHPAHHLCHGLWHKRKWSKENQYRAGSKPPKAPSCAPLVPWLVAQKKVEQRKPVPAALRAAGKTAMMKKKCRPGF